jgi:hypothetical protein
VIETNAVITAYQRRTGQDRSGRAVMVEAFTGGFVPCAVAPVSSQREASLAAVGVRADIILRVDLNALRMQPCTAPQTGVERPMTGDRIAVKVDHDASDAWYTVTRADRTGYLGDEMTLLLQRAGGEVIVQEPTIPGTGVQS